MSRAIQVVCYRTVGRRKQTEDVCVKRESQVQCQLAPRERMGSLPGLYMDATNAHSVISAMPRCRRRTQDEVVSVEGLAISAGLITEHDIDCAETTWLGWAVGTAGHTVSLLYCRGA